MELDASIEPTIGPYEVYEDEWFNYKAAFEAFITLRDDAETAKLQKFGAALQDIENHLPIDPALRNPALGALAPIRVVNVVFTAGDGNRGVQTAAFNLPNDERVIREKGSKRVMLKNVQEAKFRMVLQPIAQVALAPADRQKVSFDAFFTHILMHELMHGLGPHDIRSAARKTTVRQELKETYSAIEEAKADISGLWSLHYLVDKGVLPAVDRRLAVRHVPGVGVPVHPLRDHRGARPRHRDSAELPARPGRRDRRADGTFAVASGKVRGARGVADARDHDAAGRGRLRGGKADDRDARRRPAGGAARARSPGGRAGRHRAATSRRRRSEAQASRHGAPGAEEQPPARRRVRVHDVAAGLQPRDAIARPARRRRRSRWRGRRWTRPGSSASTPAAGIPLSSPSSRRFPAWRPLRCSTCGSCWR